MALVVETGAGLPNAESYVSVADATTYHANRGNSGWAGDDASQEQALRRATMFIDAAYRARFPGYRATLRAQALEWPRIGAYTYVPDDGRSDAFLVSGYSNFAYAQGYSYIPVDEIPREIKTATCEGALRELIEPGSLAPDLERGGAVRMLKAGSVAIEYGANASASTVFQVIDLALASLLMPASPFAGRVSRG